MKPHRMSGWARILAIAALVPALAWAQEGPGERRATVEPDDPVDRGAGIDAHAWEVMQVPGLTSASTLGTLWVNARDDAYVWTLRPEFRIPLGPLTPRTVTPEEPSPPPGNRPPAEVYFDSQLLHFDGATWSPVLEVEDEVAGTLFGIDRDDMYAATCKPDGTIRLYHFNGRCWSEERLPDGITGSVGDLAGDHSRVYFRAGNKILMGTGRHWRTVYENDLLEPGHALVFLGRDEIVAPGLHGQATWNGRDWNWTSLSWEMDVHGAWGGRDQAGELHLFVTGHGPGERGMCIDQLIEDGPGSLQGSYREVLPEPSRLPSSGLGIEAWGSGVHDVYMAGVFQDRGILVHFDGAAWRKVFPIADLTEPTSIGGTPEGDVWVALRDGRILRLPGPETPEPRVTPAGPGVGGTPRVGMTARRESPQAFVLEYGLEEARNVEVSVFDVAGRRVAVLESGVREPGRHQLRWDAGDVRPGVYFYRLRAGSVVDAGRVVVDR